MRLVCDWLSCHPRRTLFVVFLTLCPVLSYFALFKFEVHSDVRRGFAQRGGRSIEEFKKFSNFYNLSYEGLEIWVLLVTEKRTSGREYMNMSMELLLEISRLDSLVKNISVVVDGEVFHFRDIHGTDLNHLFHWYKQAYSWSRFLSGINLTFPIGEAMGHKFFLGSHFFGVNKHKESEEGPIEQIRFASLWYMNEARNFTEQQRLQALQMKLFTLSTADNFSDLISFHMYGDQVANSEMLRGTYHTVKLFSVGVILMVIFMAFAFNHMEYWSQPILIIAAIGSPAIATATCFATLGWLNFPFNSIMCITPFLVMGIGVDDAFLLLHSWRTHCKLETKERMRMVIYEIGPSMAITSATNTLAFGIGITSPTPQMSAFCLCTCVAIFLDFIFEFLIFAPMIVLFYSAREQKLKQENKIFTWENLVKILLSPCGRTVIVIGTIVMYVFASIGVNIMEASFDPSKTFPSDSPLLVSLRKFEMIQNEYSPINFISLMPSLSDSKDKANFFKMVSEIERSGSCYGPERTQLLLQEYIEWEISQNSTANSYENLPQFLELRQIKDQRIVQYEVNNGTVGKVWMNYVVQCRGDSDWNKRAQHVDKVRTIIDSYPKYETNMFEYDSTIFDLITTVKGELTKSVVITFACMTAACAFTIPSFSGASVATLSMLSISFSLLGFLSLWGQNLDPVTMINVLMAIGFSVDFSAHICYHYHISLKEGVFYSEQERMTKILQAVGRPIIEASVSTLICMCPLFFVPVYIIVAFAKTVSLVAFLGLLHGIFIIPVCLSFFPRRKAVEKTTAHLEEQKESMLT